MKRLLTCCVVAIAAGAVAAGCGSAARHRKVEPAGHDRGPTVELVESDEEADWNAPLPADVCYVAARNYEVEIGARSPRDDGLCDRLAAAYLPNEPRMRWPPPYLLRRNPDLVPSLVCVVSLGRELVAITYGPTDSGRIDAESICEGLIELGWKRQPPLAALDVP